jgi:phage repressor protein C with HTH and peptisase S24 domain
MDARERLAALAQERGVSLAALSRMLGRNASYLQQYITKGSPRKLEEADRRKLAQYFEVPEAELGAPEEISYADGGEWAEIPRRPVEVSAGPGAMAAQEMPFDAFRFSRRWLREQGFEPGHLSALRVMGDSMEPMLRDGDEVLVDERPRPFRDGIYVVRLDDRLLVKRVAAQGGGRYSLLSQNLSYPPIAVGGNEMEIIGRVVWKSGRL